MHKWRQESNLEVAVGIVTCVFLPHLHHNLAPLMFWLFPLLLDPHSPKTLWRGAIPTKDSRLFTCFQDKSSVSWDFTQ